MDTHLDISPELKERVQRIAAKARRAETDVVADALERGHSLDWQEAFIDKVNPGLADAEQGAFASAGEMMRLLNTYRST
ncbi:Predicted transcriptional regulator [Rhizobium sp. RU20A]|uniref:transcriptional regulator n=1 Tax=Rhizobium sp. RU20A TaxID=1907412 RepID=UPI000955E37B|nr:transcriptional regulator [Rhizobium sp. RU20A]SIQ36016.1 Predicted transcriptional regulator [Rhizobium sp. RU20A]